MTGKSCLLLGDHPDYIPRGVYLDLPAERYHQDPSLSASGIKAMISSPLTYWARYMDPARPAFNSDATPAKALGTALHKMLLEGEEVFYAHYAATPDPKDYPNALRGADALREKCAELHLPKSGTIAEMSRRIQVADPHCEIWSVIVDQFTETAEIKQKEIITADVAKQCLLARKAIDAHESAKEALSNGFPEVSIFWIDRHGVPMKARLDLLKPQTVVDVKSFSNQYDLPVEQAVINAITRYHYHVQAYIYVEAAKEAKILIKQGLIDRPNHEMSRYADIPIDPRFHFVFLETSDRPNILVREFPQSTKQNMALIWERAISDTKRAIAHWCNCMEAYGPNIPWSETVGARSFEDDQFPTWFTEIG